jgi:hypothetical protein
VAKKRYETPPRLILPVVADGAVATVGVGGGRLVPVVMVDMSGHPRLAELMRVHQHVESGDVVSQWGMLANKGPVVLRLAFVRPLHLTLALTFEVPRRAGLIDQVLTARGLYLQHGVEGDRMSTTQDHTRVLVEVPSTDFADLWEKMFPGLVAAEFRAAGMSRSESKQTAADMVKRWREFGSFRMPGR